jgi:hypothetical protein
MNLYETKLLAGHFKTTKSFHQSFVITKQVHGAEIVNIEDAKKKELSADGIYWKNDQFLTENIPCVYTADCLPILIEGEFGGAILHAGWRGVQKKIHLNPLIDQLGPKTILIGPSIQKESFEVSPDFKNEFPHSQYFTNQDDKVFFDLQAQVQNDLITKWPNIKITNSGVCTFKNLTYNSYRRTKLPNRNYNFYLKATL